MLFGYAILLHWWYHGLSNGMVVTALCNLACLPSPPHVQLLQARSIRVWHVCRWNVKHVDLADQAIRKHAIAWQPFVWQNRRRQMSAAFGHINPVLCSRMLVTDSARIIFTRPPATQGTSLTLSSFIPPPTVFHLDPHIRHAMLRPPPSAWITYATAAAATLPQTARNRVTL